MNRVLTILLLCAGLALFGSTAAWGKGHVPIDEIQVCDRDDDDDDDDDDGQAGMGEVDQRKESRLDNELAKGKCRLPACDAANVFFDDGECPAVDENEDGFCDLPNAPEPASTPLCTNPY